MRLDPFHQDRKLVKYNSIVCISNFLEEQNCLSCMLGKWALLAHNVFDLPTPNKVEAMPNRVEASKKA